MRNLKLITIGILSLLALFIILQNKGEVQTRLLFMSITMPLAFLLFLTALLGFSLGILVSWRTIRKKGQATGAAPESGSHGGET